MIGFCKLISTYIANYLKTKKFNIYPKCVPIQFHPLSHHNFPLLLWFFQSMFRSPYSFKLEEGYGAESARRRLWSWIHNFSLEKSIFDWGIHLSKGFREYRYESNSHGLPINTRCLPSSLLKDTTNKFEPMVWKTNGWEIFQIFLVVELMTSLLIAHLACSLPARLCSPFFISSISFSSCTWISSSSSSVSVNHFHMSSIFSIALNSQWIRVQSHSDLRSCGGTLTLRLPTGSSREDCTVFGENWGQSHSYLHSEYQCCSSIELVLLHRFRHISKAYKEHLICFLTNCFVSKWLNKCFCLSFWLI